MRKQSVRENAPDDRGVNRVGAPRRGREKVRPPPLFAEPSAYHSRQVAEQNKNR